MVVAAFQAAHHLRAGGVTVAGIPATGEDKDFDDGLTQAQFGNPLNLIMAGLIALDRREALALRRLDAARHIGRNELSRLAALAKSQDVSGSAMIYIVGVNGLAGGLPLADLRSVVGNELKASNRSTSLDALLTLLQQELPPRDETGQQPRLATIRPDLIGEAVIIEAFTGEPSREAEAGDAVRRAYGFGRGAAAQALLRLVQDFAYSLEDESATDAEKATGQRIMGWLLALMRHDEDPEHLLPLVWALPAKTIILREPAAKLTERLAVLFRQAAERLDEPDAWSRAGGLLNNLSLRLSDLGRREAALAAIEEAVAIHRDLAAARPDAFRPDLALSLSNLANSLSALGQREAALAAIEEAVAIYRGLAAARPDAFRPNLAHSLNILSVGLAALGRREAALAAIEEAVAIRRDLATARPDAFRPDLARSLNNLTGCLFDLGRREAARAAIEEAVAIHRDLAAARPDAFRPDLADSLSNLSRCLSALGRREAARAAIEEAVVIHRDLAAARPDVFRPDLARSLNNLSNVLSDLGRREAALAAIEEAVGIRRDLAAARPDAFRPDLAGSLNNLSNRLSDLGRREAALAAIEEAMAIYRDLAAARPDAFRPDLARSLNNLSNRLSDLGRREAALAAIEEAVANYRDLAAARPDAFRVDLARSLGGLAPLHALAEKPELAMMTAAEAILLLTPVFAAIPEAVGRIMAWLVQSYRAQCEALGREPDAELLQPVIAVFERLDQKETAE